MRWIAASALAFFLLSMARSPITFSARTLSAPKDFFIQFSEHRTIEEVRDYLDGRNLDLVQHYPQINTYRVGSKQRDPVPIRVVEKIRKDKVVNYFTPNELIFADQAPAPVPVIAPVAPNDQLWSQQHALQRLNLTEAWAISTGLPSVLVAVIDSGINLLHEDLDQKIWFNPDEIAGNGLDDDGNGFIDDLHGWNFSLNNNNPMDENAHGSHVGGIIGAESHNHQGISGVSWGATLMPVQFLGPDGAGHTGAAIDAILYAVDSGARMINASWGGGSRNQAMKDALRYARDREVLVIAAAGNEGQDADQYPHYPSSYESINLISVAASEDQGRLASFSNWGQASVDLVAPGRDVLSTTLDDQYQRFSGTSMAAPMAAGVAALILSRNPQFNVIELRNALLNATQHRSEYEDRISSEGDLDAYQALQQLDQGFQVWPARLTLIKGQQYPLTAYQAQGQVNWSVSNPNFAEVDSAGLVTAKQVGTFQVIAVDQSGARAFNQWIKVIEGPENSSGCSQVQNLKSPGESISASVFNTSLPFMVGFFVQIFQRHQRRRRRRLAKDETQS